ncbi:MAG: hypothetical protein J6A59_03395 [Lachnospiraceae bacterium]|nr:hypothetical protein [Lachnospiraceae bacterium]
MREIKFRGKGIITNNWFEGSLLTTEDGGVIYGKSVGGVKKETIGQYTGLKDKNGKEIYEWDILLIKEYKNDALYYGFNYEEIKELSLKDVRGELKYSYKALIHYEEGCFIVSPKNINRCEMYISEMFGDMKCSQPIYEYEVIGNIHDNPELLKEY